MQVILLKDVPKLGRRGDVKNVSDGHAENLLFPRGLAEKATPAKIAHVTEQHAAQEAARAAESLSLAKRVKEADGKRFELAAKADQKGHLYQKIQIPQIAEAIGLPESVVILALPLKEAGEHQIALQFEKTHATAVLAIVPA